jgi:hypothetical protein
MVAADGLGLVDDRRGGDEVSERERVTAGGKDALVRSVEGEGATYTERREGGTVSERVEKLVEKYTSGEEFFVCPCRHCKDALRAALLEARQEALKEAAEAIRGNRVTNDDDLEFDDCNAGCHDEDAALLERLAGEETK